MNTAIEFTVPDASELLAVEGEEELAGPAAESGLAPEGPGGGMEPDSDTDAIYGDGEESPDPIDAARKTLADATLARMALERQLKSAKKREKDAAEDLRDLVGRQQELPLADMPPAEVQKDFLSVDVDPGTPVAAGLSAEAWRSVLVTELGLKPALETKLAENSIETIGQLEDLRAGAGLRSLKGVGQTKADTIEDAVIAWLSKHRDSDVLAAAAEAQQDTAAATPLASPLSATTPAGIAANDPDALRVTVIERRTAQLLTQLRDAEEAGEGEEPLDPKCGEDKYWNAGVQAFDSDMPLKDCPWEFEAMDDWIRGWLTAKLDQEGG